MCKAANCASTMPNREINRPLTLSDRRVKPPVQFIDTARTTRSSLFCCPRRNKNETHHLALIIAHAHFNITQGSYWTNGCFPLSSQSAGILYRMIIWSKPIVWAMCQNVTGGCLQANTFFGSYSLTEGRKYSPILFAYRHPLYSCWPTGVSIAKTCAYHKFNISCLAAG